MIGLKRGIVKLVPHNKKWSLLFEKEKTRLLKEIAGDAIMIEHIGSTSIPGIKAKPVIDIAYGVKSMKDHKKHTKVLIKAGYVLRPGLGRVDRHLVFAKGTNKTRTHYLHLMKFRGKEWNYHIFFRDYLRNHKQAARKYERIKEKSMNKFRNNRKLYQKEKNS
ncbi:MAG: GrpB family protein, partial [Patescibacteria group bacterium]|nr:GrpB family protein [Patescibacteria group bacterium]